MSGLVRAGSVSKSQRGKASRSKVTWSKRSKMVFAKPFQDLKSKSRELTMSSASSLVGATVEQVTNIAQGDDFNNRDGRKIKLKSLTMRFTLGGTQGHRLVVVLDKSPNGILPTWGEVFDTSIVTDLTYVPVNTNTGGRFQILKDYTAPNGINQSGDSAVVLFDKFYLNLDRVATTTYSGTGSSVANQAQNHIYLFYVGVTSSTLNGSVQVRYVD